MVDDAVECPECNDLCCSECLSRWRQRKNTCPSCRCSLIHYNDLKLKNRYVKSLLNACEFRCENCPKTFTYEGRITHWDLCRNGNKVKCIVEGCSHAEVDFATIGLLRKHWREECLAIQVKCPCCEMVLKSRSDVPAHRNAALVNRLIARISELEYENEVLKAKDDKNKLEI